MGVLRVLLVDDSGAQRHIIRRLLEGSADVEVVGEAGNGAEAIARFRDLRPDVTLLDLIMPDMGGEQVLEALLELDAEARVVIASSMGTEDAIRRCLQSGARSFLQKPFSPEDLMRTLRTVMDTGEEGA